MLKKFWSRSYSPQGFYLTSDTVYLDWYNIYILYWSDFLYPDWILCFYHKTDPWYSYFCFSWLYLWHETNHLKKECHHTQSLRLWWSNMWSQFTHSFNIYYSKSKKWQSLSSMFIPFFRSYLGYHDLISVSIVILEYK